MKNIFKTSLLFAISVFSIASCKTIEISYEPSKSEEPISSEISSSTFVSSSDSSIEQELSSYSSEDTLKDLVFNVDDDSIECLSIEIKDDNAYMTIYSFFNLFYISYTLSFYFKDPAANITINREIYEDVPREVEYEIDLDIDIPSGNEFAYTFYADNAKTRDQYVDERVFTEKTYTYIYLDSYDSLYASRRIGRMTMSDELEGLVPDFSAYDFVDFKGYVEDKESDTPVLDYLPVAESNRVFYQLIDIDYEQFAEDACSNNRGLSASLRIELNYYNTVFGSFKRYGDGITGSGVVISGTSDTYYYGLTNYHVIQVMYENTLNGYDGIEANVKDYRNNANSFTISGVDPEHDLALIKFQSKRKLHPLKIEEDEEDMFDLRCVLAIGCPSSNPLTVTTGNYLYYSEALNDFDNTITRVVHTAALDFGSSGGPLINYKFHLVGLNVAKARDNSKFYAVNLTDIKSFVSQYDIF